MEGIPWVSYLAEVTSIQNFISNNGGFINFEGLTDTYFIPLTIDMDSGFIAGIIRVGVNSENILLPFEEMVEVGPAFVKEVNKLYKTNMVAITII